MLSYFAEIPLKTSDVNDVLDCIVVWLKASPYRVFSDMQLSEIRNGIKESVVCGDQMLSFLKFEDKLGESVGAKHVSIDRGLVTTPLL